MGDGHRLYLDQMISLHVARVLRSEGCDVKRASETGDARADDLQILERAMNENRVIENILAGRNDFESFISEMETYLQQNQAKQNNPQS